RPRPRQRHALARHGRPAARRRSRRARPRGGPRRAEDAPRAGRGPGGARGLRERVARRPRAVGRLGVPGDAGAGGADVAASGPAPGGRAVTVLERPAARAELARAAALGAFRLRASDPPWYGVVLTSAEHATETLARVRRLAALMPTLVDQVAATASQTGLDEAVTLRQWSDQLELLEGIRASLDIFLPAVFERSATDMAAAAASRTWRAEHGITLSWGTRRRLRKQARDLLRPGVAVPDLHAELEAVQARRELWRRH